MNNGWIDIFAFISVPCGSSNIGFSDSNTTISYNLTSPNYPSLYPRNLACVWIVSKSTSVEFNKLYVIMNDLVLEDDAYFTVGFGSVNVYDTYGRRRRTLSSDVTEYPSHFVSHTNAMVILFGNYFSLLPTVKRFAVRIEVIGEEDKEQGE